jgi:flagellar protein FliS
MYHNLRKANFTYEKNEVLNLSPVEITARLYQAIGRHLKSAKDALVDKDVARKGEHISRVIAIMGHLQASLNLDEGGEIASNLDRLLSFMINETTLANFRNDAARLDHVMAAAAPVINAWEELAERERDEKKSAASSLLNPGRQMAVHAAC